MATVCERIVAGELVQDVAADLGVHPQRVSEWALLPEFAEVYARAREQQAHAFAEQALAVADGVDPQTVAALEAIDAEEIAADELDGPSRAAAKALVASLRSNVIQRDRLRVDTRKWLASKLAPKHYGEKQAVEHSGPGGGSLSLDVRFVDAAADAAADAA